MLVWSDMSLTQLISKPLSTKSWTPTFLFFFGFLKRTAVRRMQLTLPYWLQERYFLMISALASCLLVTILFDLCEYPDSKRLRTDENSACDEAVMLSRILFSYLSLTHSFERALRSSVIVPCWFFISLKWTYQSGNFAARRTDQRCYYSYGKN